jgi:hypothetical protein
MQVNLLPKKLEEHGLEWTEPDWGIFHGDFPYFEAVLYGYKGNGFRE